MSVKISLEELRRGQKKKILKKIMYLKRKLRNKRCYFITITFRTFDDYIEYDLKERKKLMDNLRKNYGLEAAFSVVEPQRRGVPHVHLLAWIPYIHIDKKFGKIYKTLGLTNIKRVKNKYIIYYLLKYMLKEDDLSIIKYKYKQRMLSFYYKHKRKDKEWILMGLTGINRILRKYEIKRSKIEYNYINVGGNIIKYKIYTSFREDGLLIKDVHLVDIKEGVEYWLDDFPNYLEFLSWFESFIIVKLNMN
jgi:hypothetical protein